VFFDTKSGTKLYLSVAKVPLERDAENVEMLAIVTNLLIPEKQQKSNKLGKVISKPR
jgi:hypothetical protein